MSREEGRIVFLLFTQHKYKGNPKQQKGPQTTGL